MDPLMQVAALCLIAVNIGCGLEKIAKALARDKTIHISIVVKKEGKEDGPP